ncbi:MAG TPA: glycoside hydrolase family 3 C-terminal domain-containing protein [Sphingomonas sp.]|nr:glycoside hydrolase family 3 C-terminal domain-containing protein [Sphingomonas sp.]
MPSRFITRVALVAALVGAGASHPVLSRDPASYRAWQDARLSPDVRADALLAAMTREEKLSLVRTHFPNKMQDRPADVPKSAGYHPGIARLGIPEQRLTDASLGIAANQRPPDQVTALPSGLAIAATWDPALARAGGALIAREARQMGFNILLGGGVNLVRDPRGGRSFEYLGEDALLAGILAGHAIAGTQSEHVLSTVKHFVLNAQETGRAVVDAQIPLPDLRASDLFAFQKAIEIGRPGSVMCSYNRINGPWACEDPVTMGVLKRDWRYPGYVMSDWGGVHSTVASANAGLDQESGWEIAPKAYFGRELATAVARGEVPPARLDDMVRRILRSLFAAGLFDRLIVRGAVDVAGGAEIARTVAANGIVLLKNRAALLPLSPSVRRIVVIGRQANFGVLSGGGSSQVIPIGSRRVDPPAAAPAWGRGTIYHPGSPLEAIRRLAPRAEVTWVDGHDPSVAAAAARRADVAVLFAHLWASEAMDAALTLPDDQDQTIAAVTAANPRTVVVLENNAAVLMPWIDSAGAVLAAWYSGSRGGNAIADVLFGRTDAAGRLPISFPKSVRQLPVPDLPGEARAAAERELPEADQPRFSARYVEGADVGYRWYARTGTAPLFPFGFGLSYTRFAYSGLAADAEGAHFTVINGGPRTGTDTPQVYIAGPGKVPRLAGWARVTLAPGGKSQARIRFDPRSFASFDEAGRRWVVAPGRYRVILGRHSGDIAASVTVAMPRRTYAADWIASADQFSQR